MKTKNIFKALALAMMMPAMMLTTACSSDDDAVNNGNNKKGYALPVTVNVTRQGDKANTRATYNESTKKFSFSSGDKLFVCGNDDSESGAGEFAGTLNYVSEGTFSGTITTENEYKGTFDALFTAGDASATLVPDGYESFYFWSFNWDKGYNDFYLPYYEYAFVTSTNDKTAKALAVEQFSNEYGKYTSGTGFELSPKNAILSFTINGLTPNTTYTVTLTNDVSYDITYDISGDVTTDDSGNALFAVAVQESDFKNLSLTVGVNAITLANGGKSLEAGNIYNINRCAYTMAANATASDKGKLICTTGHIHAYGEDAECTAERVAKIIYLGTTGEESPYTHGLALALTDEDKKEWASAKAACNIGKNISTPVTNAIWLLASKDQWNYLLGTNGANGFEALRDGFNDVGGTNLQLYGAYWSSTEIDASHAWIYGISTGAWLTGTKGYGYDEYVRACLAF